MQILKNPHIDYLRWKWPALGLSAAIIPTDAPATLDRFVTAMALTSGPALAGLAVYWLFRAQPERQRVQGGAGLTAPGPPVSTS